VSGDHLEFQVARDQIKRVTITKNNKILQESGGIVYGIFYNVTTINQPYILCSMHLPFLQYA